MSKFIEYKVFVSVVEQGSFTKAADRLNVSVSSVSKQIRHLEEKLGLKLIDRSTQSISITELGRKFYQHCRDILASIEEVEQSLRDDMAEPAGKLVISISNVLLKTPFMSILQQFNLQYPKIKFDINVANQFENLVQKQIDFAFRIGHLEDSGLIAVSLLKTKLQFFASAEYKALNGEPKSIESLVDHNVIVPSYLNLSEVSGGIVPGLGKLNLEYYHSSNDCIALHEAACVGMGIIPTLDIAVAKEVKEGSLVPLFSGQSFHQKDLYLVYHKRDYMPKKMILFKEFIKENFARIFSELRV